LGRVAFEISSDGLLFAEEADDIVCKTQGNEYESNNEELR
jgi:hypothetical protein